MLINPLVVSCPSLPDLVFEGVDEGNELVLDVMSVIVGWVADLPVQRLYLTYFVPLLFFFSGELPQKLVLLLFKVGEQSHEPEHGARVQKVYWVFLEDEEANGFELVLGGDWDSAGVGVELQDQIGWLLAEKALNTVIEPEVPGKLLGDVGAEEVEAIGWAHGDDGDASESVGGLDGFWVPRLIEVYVEPGSFMAALDDSGDHKLALSIFWHRII